MKGFTLIELLIVIAILAILTTSVVLVLNPAQMLAEARDSQRMSDLGSIRSAISLYLATASTTTLGAGPISQGGNAGCLSLSGTCVVTGASLLYTVDGTGWVAVNLGAASGGSPLAVLPRDPVNNAALHYAYAGNDTYKTFELNAALESVKYSPKMTTDGGPTDTVYEVGTDPGLDL